MASSKTTNKKKVPELRVVFDTSVLYTGSESNLVSQEAADLIKVNSSHKDIAIKWYFPEVVRHERQFQMQSKAVELLPPIKRLERLLGHNLNITEEIVKQRVDDTIEAQILALGLSKLELDTKVVDWNRLILDACYRKLPFTAGEKEKGFRDSLISEAFMQLVKASPKSRDICRVVLVAMDKELRNAVEERIKNVRNVIILESLEDLKGLINTLVAEVTEQFVKSIRGKARTYFFDAETKTGLYISEKIRSRIRKKFKKNLEELPENAEEREVKGWFIGAPRFARKEGQRVFWATRITVRSEAYKSARDTTAYFTQAGATNYGTYGTSPDITLYRPSGDVYTGEIKLGTPSDESLWITPTSSTADLSELNIAGGQNWITPSPFRVYTYDTGSKKKELVSSGETIFEVVWSVLLTTKRNFTSARVESISYVGTNWE